MAEQLQGLLAKHSDRSAQRVGRHKYVELLMEKYSVLTQDVSCCSNGEWTDFEEGLTNGMALNYPSKQNDCFH
jgi:hypothetical protein